MIIIIYTKCRNRYLGRVITRKKMKMLMMIIHELARWHFIVLKIFIKKNIIKGKKKTSISLLLHHIFASFLKSDGCIKWSKYLKASGGNTFYFSNLKYYSNFNKGMYVPAPSFV